MSIRNRGFRWWWWRLALMLAFSTWLTYELLEQGLFVTRNIPPGGIDGPVCYETGGLFSRNASVFRYIECAHFHGSSVAAYLLTRGLYLKQSVIGPLVLGLEILAAAPVAFLLSLMTRDRKTGKAGRQAPSRLASDDRGR